MGGAPTLRRGHDEASLTCGNEQTSSVLQGPLTLLTVCALCTRVLCCGCSSAGFFCLGTVPIWFCCGLSLQVKHILCPCRPRVHVAEHNSNLVTHFGGSHWCIAAGTCTQICGCCCMCVWLSLGPCLGVASAYVMGVWIVSCWWGGWVGLGWRPHAGAGPRVWASFPAPPRG